MFYEAFIEVYTKFKLHFYKEVFKKWKDREVSLTTVETFCMEIIFSLGRPTVSQFAEFTSLSSANAADKVNKLIGKGYLNKVQSEEDKRVYFLEVTQKYLDYYNISYRYMDAVMKRVQQRFTKEELEVADKIMKVMGEELMSEINYDASYVLAHTEHS